MIFKRVLLPGWVGLVWVGLFYGAHPWRVSRFPSGSDWWQYLLLAQGETGGGADWRGRLWPLLLGLFPEPVLGSWLLSGLGILSVLAGAGLLGLGLGGRACGLVAVGLAGLSPVVQLGICWMNPYPLAAGLQALGLGFLAVRRSEVAGVLGGLALGLDLRAGVAVGMAGLLLEGRNRFLPGILAGGLIAWVFRAPLGFAETLKVQQEVSRQELGFLPEGAMGWLGLNLEKLSTEGNLPPLGVLLIALVAFLNRRAAALLGLPILAALAGASMVLFKDRYLLLYLAPIAALVPVAASQVFPASYRGLGVLGVGVLAGGLWYKPDSPRLKDGKSIHAREAWELVQTLEEKPWMDCAALGLETLSKTSPHPGPRNSAGIEVPACNQWVKTAPSGSYLLSTPGPVWLHPEWAGWSSVKRLDTPTEPQEPVVTIWLKQ